MRNALAILLAPAPPAQSAPAAPPTRSSRRDIDAILAAPTLARGTWGVARQDRSANDETLYALNAHKLLMPASNMKIVTLAAAAERLGWDYTLRDAIVRSGRIEAGALNGDLVVVGSGDPSLMARDGGDACSTNGPTRLRQPASAPSPAGSSATTTRSTIRRWASAGRGTICDGYAAGVGALQFNENTVRVTVAPGTAVGDQRRVTVIAPGGRAHRRQLDTNAAAGTAASITPAVCQGAAVSSCGGTIPAGAAPVT